MNGKLRGVERRLSRRSSRGVTTLYQGLSAIVNLDSVSESQRLLACQHGVDPPLFVRARRVEHGERVVGDSHIYGAFGSRLHERLAGVRRWVVVSEVAGDATTKTYLEEHPLALVGYRVRESTPRERTPRVVVDRIKSATDRAAEAAGSPDGLARGYETEPFESPPRPGDPSV